MPMWCRKTKKSLLCKTCSNIKKNNDRFGEFERRICKCGNKKNRQAPRCHQCKKKRRWEAVLEKTIREVINKNYPTRAVYNQVRKYAREMMEFSNQDKKCKICGYSKHVDVCHIKPVTEFDIDSKVKSPTNLKVRGFYRINLKH